MKTLQILKNSVIVIGVVIFLSLFSTISYAPIHEIDVIEEVQQCLVPEPLPTKYMQRALTRTLEYRLDVIAALKEEELNPTIQEVSEVLATIAHESGGWKHAKGSSGEVGLMQLMPSTARLMRVNPHKPYQNILGGIRYRKHLREDFGFYGEKTLAAYNAGPGNVQRGYVPKKYIKSVKKWAKIFIDILESDYSIRFLKKENIYGRS